MKKLTDTELAARVEALAKQAVGPGDSLLTTERTSVQRYYDGLEPKPLHAGDSKYVSMDVYDAVEAMKAQLLETFSGNAQPVKFAPQGQEDVGHAKDATEYASYAIFRQNDGFGVLRDAIDDALKARVGIAKVWWENDYEDVDETVEDVPYADFQAILGTKPDATLSDLELDGEGQTVTKATLTSRKDTSQVRIELVPPEEFGISRLAKSAQDASIVFHRTTKTVDELRRMGVPEKLLKDLKDDDRFWSNADPEILERHAETSDAVGMDDARDSSDAARKVSVTEAYCRMDLDGRPKLWRIVVANGKLLLKETVLRLPFVFFVPLPRPHSFWGSNYAKKVIPTQNARTFLTRSIINHALITNNPRTGVVKGGLVNPKELMENRLGGLVNLTRPDALVPIVQTGLNPFVFQTIALLDEDKEETTGISKLSQGLNKDAISKQNSADMVASLIGGSQVRQKVVARNLAEGFLKHLYLEVYRLIVENEKAERIIEVAGAWRPVDPTTWPDRKDVVAEISVGFGEKAKEIERFTQIDQYLANDPRLAAVYTADRRHHVLTQILNAMGVKDVNSVLADPGSVPPPEPDPMQLAEVAVKNGQAKSAEAQAVSTIEKLKLDAQAMQLDHEFRMAELQMKARESDANLEIEKLKLQSHQVQFQKEMVLAEAAMKQGNLTAVAAPDA